MTPHVMAEPRASFGGVSRERVYKKVLGLCSALEKLHIAKISNSMSNLTPSHDAYGPRASANVIAVSTFILSRGSISLQPET